MSEGIMFRVDKLAFVCVSGSLGRSRAKKTKRWIESYYRYRVIRVRVRK